MNVLALRMILGAVGLGLALVAIARDDRRVTWLAIGVLVVALGLRFLQPPGDRRRR
ncbi:MAG TPA: hypothetical protein VLA95_08300 [Gemmatimonadales bacterium]|nr:hypothetical protein [Gemmatimonadales bacterium]